MMKKSNSIPWWATLFWLLVWQGASMAMAAAYPHGHILLASPVEALTCLLRLSGSGEFWGAVWWSTCRIAGGFFLACVLAVVLAALSARFRLLRELLAPLVAVVKAVPVVSFIILALVFFSSRTLSTLISALMVFPPIYLHVLSAIGGTDPQLLEMAQVFRIPFRRQLVGIYLPAVLPAFRTSASLALGLCWKAGIAAEVIGLPGGSIGEKLHSAKIYFETAELFAWTAVIVLLAWAVERLVLGAVDILARKVGC